MSHRLSVWLAPSLAFKRVLGFSYLLLMSGALLPPLLSPGGSGDISLQEGLPELQVAMAALLLLLAFELLRAFWRRPLMVLLRAAWLPALLVLLALASYAWSVDPSLTLRRGVALAGTFLLAVFLLASLGYRRSVMLVTWLLAVVAVLSLLAAVLVPSVGVHQVGSHLGRWKGVYLHKNLLGREMALGAGLFLLAAFHSRSPRRRWLWFTLSALAVLLVAQSRSATGAVAAAAALVVAVTLHWSRARPKVAAVLVMLGAVGATILGFVMALAPDRLVELVGRDLTFTGRTTLWSAVLDKVAESPLVGHGYRAFWGSPGGAAISDRLGWRVTHAHNAFLDVGLSLGVAGFLLVVCLVLTPLLRWALAAFGRAPGTFRYHETGVVVAVTILAVSASDSILLGPNNLFLLLLFLQFAGLRRPLRTEALGRVSPPRPDPTEVAPSPLTGGTV